MKSRYFVFSNMYHQPFWFINEKKSEQASLLSVRKVVLLAFIMLVT